MHTNLYPFFGSELDSECQDSFRNYHRHEAVFSKQAGHVTQVGPREKHGQATCNISMRVDNEKNIYNLKKSGCGCFDV